MSAVTSSGEDASVFLSATLCPRRITITRSATVKTSGMRLADENDRDTMFGQPFDEAEHLRHLPHADCGRRFIHDDEPRLGEARASDRHSLSLAS